MFRPNQTAIVCRTGEPVTLLPVDGQSAYLGRTEVGIRYADGTTAVVPEHTLRRPFSDQALDIISQPDKAGWREMQRASALRKSKRKSPLDDIPSPDDSEERRNSWLRALEQRRKGLDLLVEGVKSGKITVDWNGHNHKWKADDLHKTLCKRIGQDTFGGLLVEGGHLEPLIAALESGTPLAEPVGVGPVLSMGCGVCGKSHYSGLDAVCDGVTLAVIERCEMADWNGTTVIELNVPSGKLIVDDDLRELTRLPVGGYDVNGDKGIQQTTKLYEKAGMAHGFVGNTCPSVYSDKEVEDGFLIANIPEEHEDAWGKSLAGVCTDLWWYSLIDAEEAKRRAVAFGLAKTGDEYVAKHIDSRWERNIIDVKPGLYRLTHYHDNDRDDYSTPTIYARFVRIGDAKTDVPDFVDTLANFQVTAAQACHTWALKRWPTLAESPNLAGSLAAAADQFLCHGGVPSRDWHRNGFPNDFSPWDADLVSEAEAVEIPPFHFQKHWYSVQDIGRHSTIATAALGKDPMFGGDCPLNPSFAKLAFNILESIISYGVLVDLRRDVDKGDCYQLPQDAMRSAAKVYHKLAKRYPDGVDPEFHAWMQDRRRVSAWIKRWVHGVTVPNKLTGGTRIKVSDGRKGYIVGVSDYTLKKVGIEKLGAGQHIVQIGRKDDGLCVLHEQDLTVRQEGGKTKLSPTEQAYIDAQMEKERAKPPERPLTQEQKDRLTAAIRGTAA
jgi:hypothetical protein